MDGFGGICVSLIEGHLYWHGRHPDGRIGGRGFFEISDAAVARIPKSSAVPSRDQNVIDAHTMTAVAFVAIYLDFERLPRSEVLTDEAVRGDLC